MLSRLSRTAVFLLLCLLARTPSPALGKVNIVPPPEGGNHASFSEGSGGMR